MKFKLLLILQLFAIYTFSKTTGNDSIPTRIVEERFVLINGIEQWVTIKGNSTKPVVLFIHGGPGSPLSPYADAIYGEWEKDFLLVQWDQRGTGRTYGRNAPAELTPAYLQSNPLTIEQMTADGIELSKHLIQRLGKQKIILFGTSWGSVLATKMALKNPELFYAYIGHSQMVNPSETAFFTYTRVQKLAQEVNDEAALNLLTAIGKPPYDTARSVGKLIQLTKKYQEKNATAPPATWMNISAAYDTEKDNADRSDGDDYSFVHYAGDKRLGIKSLSSTLNFFEEDLEFKLPVYFIQGEDDLQTPAAVTKVYFQKIKAPHKEFILLPQTGHGFNQSVITTQLEIMIKYIVPAIN